VLRIHFTPQDVRRVRLASRPHPLWETVLAVQLLQHSDGAAEFAGWRREARAAIRAAGAVAGARLLTSLAPNASYFPDFLTPGVHDDVETGVDAVLSTPRGRLAAEIGRLGRHHRLPALASRIAGGEPAALAELGDALRSVHRLAVDAHAPHVQARIDADLAVRSRALLSAGVDGLLSSYPPLMRWAPPVLHVRYGLDKDLHLRGRGLVLVPAFFCWGSAVALADADLPPVLVHPVAHDRGQPWRRGAPGAALAALLGTTRANALQAVGAGCTTTELARRLRVSVPSASRHASVLRDAGLVESTRSRNTVVHTLTTLGRELLTRGGSRG
jgi:DNA-binding transcriptional ArsR family regulator